MSASISKFVVNQTVARAAYFSARRSVICKLRKEKVSFLLLSAMMSNFSKRAENRTESYGGTTFYCLKFHPLGKLTGN